MADRPGESPAGSSISGHAASHADAPADPAPGGPDPAARRRRIPAAVRAWAVHLKRETHALLLACQDRRTPWYARALAGFVVAYALSPIDLIPDVIPVLGALDDLILLPLGLWLALRMIPPEVMEAARLRASESTATATDSMRGGAAIVVAIWLLAVILVIVAGWRAMRG